MIVPCFCALSAHKNSSFIQELLSFPLPPEQFVDTSFVSARESVFPLNYFLHLKLQFAEECPRLVSFLAR